MDLTITPAAEAFMRRIVRFGGGGGFRLVVTPGGCSGLSSEFTVEPAPQAGETVVTSDGGVQVFLPEPTRQLLDGYIVDFADTPTETGLRFHHPEGRSVCGCGSSAGGHHPPGQSGVTTVSIASIGRRGGA